jgi:hypothetical protein
MFGTHFYHATMRKSVAVFGTLFNDISVVRRKSDGSIVNQIRVPLAYGPKQKFLARLDQETGFDAPMGIKLPRMSFEITSLELDVIQKGQKRNKIVETHGSDVTKKKTIQNYTAYNIGMQLSILAKNQDDGLQIVEQILPYFQPEYTLTIKPVSGFDLKQDVPVVLTSVAINDEYEGSFEERRVLTYTLDFVMKMKFYGPTVDQALIREVNLDFENKSTGEFYEGLNYTVRPSDTAATKVVTVAYDENQFVVGGGTFQYAVSIEPIGVIGTTAVAVSNTAEVQLVNTTGLQVGHVISGTGISGSPQVSSINSPTSITLTAAQNIGNNVALTFTANKYSLFDQVQPRLTLYRGNTYIFTHPPAHPFKISETSDGTHTAGGVAYTTGVVTSAINKTGTVAGAVNSSTSVTLSSAVEGIKIDDAVTGTGISGIVTVAAISGTSLTLSSAQTIASGVNLTIATHITTFAVAENAPENLYYYCPNHIKMGGDIIVLTS